MTGCKSYKLLSSSSTHLSTFLRVAQKIRSEVTAAQVVQHFDVCFRGYGFDSLIEAKNPNHPK